MTKLSNRTIYQSKEAIKYARLTIPILKFLNSSHISRDSRINNEHAQELKKQKEVLFNSMNSLSDEKHYFLSTNDDMFKKMLRHDEESLRFRESQQEEKKRKRESLVLLRSNIILPSFQGTRKNKPRTCSPQKRKRAGA